MKKNISKMDCREQEVVVDHDGNLAGIADEAALFQNLGLEHFVSSDDMMNVTAGNVVLLEPNEPFLAALRLMRGSGVSRIVIVNALKPVGVITERDVVRLVREKADLRFTHLRDVMSRLVVGATCCISNVLPSEVSPSRLLIVETYGGLTGVITEADMFKCLQSEYIHLLRQLIDKQVNQLRTVCEQLNEKNILETMMHSLSDIAFVVTDLDYKVLHSNKMAEKLFEYSLEEVNRKGIISILEEEWNGQSSLDQVVERIKKQGKFSITYHKKHGGVASYIEVNIFGVKNNDRDVHGYVLIARDISDNIETSKRLKKRGEELEETNSALKVLLKQRETDKEEIRQAYQDNIEKLILPFFNKLRNSATSPAQEEIIKSIENNLRQISSPFAHRISSIYSNLSPAEIQVANLIKNGHSSKEIASLLNLSLKTVYTHRRNMRKKIGITNQNVNLQGIFQQID